MKKSLILTLTDEELIELERIMIDDDCEAALRFLRKHIKDKARGALENRGHCKPWFEIFGQSAITSQSGRPEGSEMKSRWAVGQPEGGGYPSREPRLPC